jgi:hypothetical protein
MFTGSKYLEYISRNRIMNNNRMENNEIKEQDESVISNNRHLKQSGKNILTIAEINHQKTEYSMKCKQYTINEQYQIKHR